MMINMVFKKRFSEQDIIKALKENPAGLMLMGIQMTVGCSEMTVRKLLKPLIEKGDVEKKNIGASKKRPVNLYILVYPNIK